MTKSRKWKKQGGINIHPGMVITGKWYKNSYPIKRKLGTGAIGSVYLCKANGQLAALKISEQSTQMTVEVNVLKSLQKVRESRLGPYLLDVDDWESPWGKVYSFYVMEYIRGENMRTFIQNQGDSWIGVFMLQLLESLEKLHQSGWVFGDLKLENIIIDPSPPRARFVDVGGTTQIGRAIKEYTEFYDRGYWGLGTRKAEPSYDLFALSMVCLSIYYPNHFPKSKYPDRTLFSKLHAIKPLIPYRAILRKALLGKYHSSSEMKKDVSTIFVQRRKNNTAKNKGEKRLFFTESLFMIIIAVIYYTASLLLP